jgi:hypothetical protein
MGGGQTLSAAAPYDPPCRATVGADHRHNPRSQRGRRRWGPHPPLTWRSAGLEWGALVMRCSWRSTGGAAWWWPDLALAAHSRCVAAGSGIASHFTPPPLCVCGLVAARSGAGDWLPARGGWFHVEWPPPHTWHLTGKRGLVVRAGADSRRVEARSVVGLLILPPSSPPLAAGCSLLYGASDILSRPRRWIYAMLVD